MKLELCDFELSLMLKEVGFDEECDENFCLETHKFPTGLLVIEGQSYPFRLGVIRNACRPTLELAKMWFREVHGINLVIQKVVGNKGTAFETVTYTHEGSPWRTKETYNQALSAGLKEACKRIK